MTRVTDFEDYPDLTSGFLGYFLFFLKNSSLDIICFTFFYIGLSQSYIHGCGIIELTCFFFKKIKFYFQFHLLTLDY